MSLGMKKTEPRPNSSEACKVASLLVIMGDRFSLACVRDCFTEFQIDELAKEEHRYERDGKENIARVIVIKSGRQFRVDEFSDQDHREQTSNISGDGENNRESQNHALLPKF